jgi:polyhydroxybutyrate depolymerase
MGHLLRFGRTLLPLALGASLSLLLAACGPGQQFPPGSGDPGGSGSPSASPASSVGAKIPVGRSTQTMALGGVQRTVQLYRPKGLTGTVPLVVMLHGGYGSGTQAEDSYHWDPQADSGHFLLALPDGLNKSWNAGGGCCGQSAKQGVNDVAFLTQLVTMLKTEMPIDAHRVYISGMSNGGVMAYRMACETNLFAAVGVNSTTMLVPCTKAQPTAVLHIHGTADPVIPYLGGTGVAYGPGGSAITTPPIPTINADWRTTDHCATPKVTVKATLTTSIVQCPKHKTVELITIAGAGHEWPGGTVNPVVRKLFDTGPTSNAIDATSTIWQFFSTRT